MMIKDHSFSHSVGHLCDSSDVSIPEEFLDPITQEVMMLPMLLPSGVSVDNTTLEEHQKREATWGRPPNDPFTGVPFSSTSQPIPNPQLKNRIDHFLLQKGIMSRDGMLGRQGDRANPQASRLVASTVDAGDGGNSSLNDTVVKFNPGFDNTKRTAQLEDSGVGHSFDHLSHTSESQPLAPDSNSVLGRGNKRGLNGESRDGSMTENRLLPQTKRQRKDAVSEYNLIIKCFIFPFFCFFLLCENEQCFSPQLQLSRTAFVSQPGRGTLLSPAGPTLLHLQLVPAGTVYVRLRATKHLAELYEGCHPDRTNR